MISPIFFHRYCKYREFVALYFSYDKRSVEGYLKNALHILFKYFFRNYIYIRYGIIRFFFKITSKNSLHLLHENFVDE